MKANEMPEKIYIFDFNDAMVTPMEGDTVYVREDAFIEKAIVWLKNGLDYGLWVDQFLEEEVKEAIVEDFVKYMKGK